MRVASILFFLLLGMFIAAENYNASIRGGIRNDVNRFERLTSGLISCPICADENGKLWMSSTEFSLRDKSVYSNYKHIRNCDVPDSSSSLTIYPFAYDDIRCVKLRLFEIDNSANPTGRVGQIRLSYTLFLKFSQLITIPAPVPPGVSWRFDRSTNFLMNITTCSLPEVECFTDDFVQYHKNANFEVPQRPEASTAQSPAISYEKLQQKLIDAEKLVEFKQTELADSQKVSKRFESFNHALLKENTALQLENRALQNNLTKLEQEKQLAHWQITFEIAKLKAEKEDARYKILKLNQDLFSCKEETATNLETIQNETVTMNSMENEIAEARSNLMTASDRWDQEKVQLEDQQRLSNDKISGLLYSVDGYGSRLEQGNATMAQLQEESAKHQEICSKKIQGCEQDLQTLRNNITSLNDDLNKYREACSKRQEKIKQLSKEDQKTEERQSRQNFAFTVDKLEKEKQNLQQKIKALEASLSDLHTSIAKIHNETEATRKELVNSRDTNKALTDQLFAVNSSVSELEAERASLYYHIEHAQLETNRLEKLLSVASTSLTEKEQELDVCRTNTSLVTEMNSEIRSQLEELKTTAQSVASELSDTTSCARQLTMTLIVVSVLLIAGVLISTIFTVFYCSKKRKASPPKSSASAGTYYECEPSIQPTLPLDRLVWMHPQSSCPIEENEAGTEL